MTKSGLAISAETWRNVNKLPLAGIRAAACPSVQLMVRGEIVAMPLKVIDCSSAMPLTVVTPARVMSSTIQVRL